MEKTRRIAWIALGLFGLVSCGHGPSEPNYLEEPEVKAALSAAEIKPVLSALSTHIGEKTAYGVSLDGKVKATASMKTITGEGLPEQGFSVSVSLEDIKGDAAIALTEQGPLEYAGISLKAYGEAESNRLYYEDSGPAISTHQAGMDGASLFYRLYEEDGVAYTLGGGDLDKLNDFVKEVEGVTGVTLFGELDFAPIHSRDDLNAEELESLANAPLTFASAFEALKELAFDEAYSSAFSFKQYVDEDYGVSIAMPAETFVTLPPRFGYEDNGTLLNSILGELASKATGDVNAVMTFDETEVKSLGVAFDLAYAMDTGGTQAEITLKGGFYAHFAYDDAVNVPRLSDKANF